MRNQVLASSLVFAIAFFCKTTTAALESKSMTLIFEDSFEGTRLDLSRWHVGSQPNGSQWGSESHFVEKIEQQYSETYIVSNGILKIRSTYDPSYADPQKAWKRRWFSGLVIPAKQDGTPISFRRGCIKVRMQLPAGKGVWPAVWAMNLRSTSSPPDQRGSVELDGLEAYGALLPHRFSSGTHDWNNPDRPGNPSMGAIHDNLAVDLTTSMHDYMWCLDERFFTTYLDGGQLSSLEIPRFDTIDAFYWMINLAMGGGWPISVPESRHYELKIDHVQMWSSD